MATQEYEQRFRRIPGLFENFCGQHFEVDEPIPNTTWAVELLADLERGRVLETYSEGRMGDVFIELYVCPSDGELSFSGAEMSYVANGGRAASAAEQRVQNGAFLNRIHDPEAKALDGHWLDGREYTLAYSENIDATFYDEVGWNGFKDVQEWAVDSDFVDKDHDDRAWNPVFFWAPENDSSVPQQQTRINTPGLPLDDLDCNQAAPRRYTSSSCDERSGKLLASWARPSSYHPGGVNVAFIGGRVMFLREDIDYTVYIALMTLHDRQSDSPVPDFQLQDNHYR